MQYIIPTVQLEINKKLPSIPEKRCWQNSPIPRPDLDSIERRHRWSPPPHTHTHTHARAQTQDASLPRFSPFNGGEEGNPFRGCPVIRGYIVRGARAPEGGEGWCVTPRAGWTNETGGGREEGGGWGRGKRASFRTVLEKVVAYTTFTDLHYPRIAPTLDTHHRPPQIVPLQRRVRDGRPAAAAPRHRRDPLNDTRPPALPSPYSSQPRPRVSFTRQNYVTVARTSRPKFFHSARTRIVR